MNKAKTIIYSIILLPFIIFSQDQPQRSFKKYSLVTKGMKLVEIDEDGDPINMGKRYAIVVGINDYNDTAISDLSKARNDAKATGKILKEIGQFDQVFMMTDDIGRNDPENLYPTKLNIEEKIESILRFSTPDDLIVFFFSGHGISDYEENGYLITVDTLADRKHGTALKVDWIVGRFKDKKIKKSLLILDACRDTLYTSKSSDRDSIKEKTYSEAEVAATFYSTKAGFYSYEDDESDYGVFTKHLIYGMEGVADYNKDGVVSFAELEQYVNKGVKDWSIKKNKQQKPFTKIYGEKTGDLAITAANNPEQSLADKKVPESLSKLEQALHSTLIPGWGQWKNDRKGKASLFFFAGLGSLVYYGYTVNHLNDAKKNYDSTIPIPAMSGVGETFAFNAFQFQTKRNLVDARYSQSQNAYSLLLAIWTINILDAYFFSQSNASITFDYNNQRQYDMSGRLLGIDRVASVGLQIQY